MRGYRWRGWRFTAACVAACVAFPLADPPAALAAHSAGEACYNCHTLDEREADLATSMINKQARTFPNIKRYVGPPPAQTPENLGCTYCHNDNGHTDRMLPALTHFQGRTSFHPVGFAFEGPGGETSGEYLSTQGSATPGELDCVDCHDLEGAGDGSDDPETGGVDEGSDGDAGTSFGGAARKYPEHGPPADPANNPFMLRGVTVAEEYDALCRLCHRSDAPLTVKGVSLQLSAHADGAPGRPLREIDGTVLRTADLDQDGSPDAAGLAATAQCTACHDTHFSSNRRLFNDGHEQHKTAGRMIDDAPVTSGNCTGICHYAGDWNSLAAGGNYYRHGHGKAQSTYKYRTGRPDAGGTEVTMGYACTACHVGLDPAQKPHANDTSGATEQERYVRRFNLSLTVQAGDTGSPLGNPLKGICLTCHQRYDEHRTDQGSVGCQDCHDEHGEGMGAGAGNVMMIPERAKRNGFYVAPAPAFAEKAGAESIVYDTPRYDLASDPYAAAPAEKLGFHRRDGPNGICDSAECHPRYTPLASWISVPGRHSGGVIDQGGADCASCHAHNGDAGGWRAE